MMVFAEIEGGPATKGSKATAASGVQSDLPQATVQLSRAERAVLSVSIPPRVKALPRVEWPQVLGTWARPRAVIGGLIRRIERLDYEFEVERRERKVE